MADTFTWIDPANTSVALNDGVNTNVGWGVSGDVLPQYTRNDVQLPAQPGSQLMLLQVSDRTLTLPFWIKASTKAALLTLMRQMVFYLDAQRGDGILRVTRTDLTARQLTCRYVSGLNDSSNASEPNLLWIKTALTFKANDPFWYATTPQTVTYASGTVPSFFPFFPLQLAGGTVFTNTVVNNPGDTAAWPVWTITGPGTYLTLANLTTGKTLYLNYTLAAGTTVIIDTRPGAKTLLTGTGVSVFSSAVWTLPTSLWPLAQGSNTLQITFNGATAASRVALSFYPRYLSA
jgi:hypothetical protein